MTYAIEKKSPASNWYTIHCGWDKETADQFLIDMAQFDHGQCDLENGTASYNEGGDIMQYRAVQVSQ